MRALTKALGALAVATLLAACSGEETLEPDSVEQSISTQLEAEVGEVPKSVDCPEEIPAQADSTFTCTVTTTSRPMSRPR